MIRSFLIGLYAWTVTIFAGAVLLDVAYSRLLSDAQATPAVATAFSAVSDLLLYVVLFVVLLALLAIVASWRAGAAIFFFIASLLVLVAEFFAPAFLPLVLPGAGYLVRIGANSLASALAFAGVFAYRRSR